MDPLYARAFIEGTPPAEGPIRFVAGTGGLKRDGRDYKVDGIDLDRFNRNPVILWVHNQAAPPIGRAIATEVDGDRLMIDVEFDQEDEFARSVESKYRRGFLNAVSMLAVPKAGQPSRGLVAESELFEVSACGIPLDPDCLVTAGRTALIEMGRDLDRVGRTINDRLSTFGRELSANDKRSRLNTLGSERFGGEDIYVWTADYGDDWVVFEVDGPEGCTYWRMGYSSSEDDLSLEGEPVEVIRKTEYTPVADGQEADGEGGDETMRSLAAALEGMGFQRSTPSSDLDTALAQLADAFPALQEESND